MFCYYCGHKGGDGTFCTNCGTQLTVSCVGCGSVILGHKDFRHCYECGEFQPTTKNRVKKISRKDLLYKTYPSELDKIISFLKFQNDWVSYQQIAEHLGLSTCYTKLNPKDDKSTVGQLVYLGDIRGLGYEVQAYSFKTQNDVTNSTRNHVIRFIKAQKIQGRDISIDEVLQESKRAYPNTDFNQVKTVAEIMPMK